MREADFEKIDEKRRSDVEEDMLQVEQRGEEKRGFDVTTLKDARDGEYQNAEEEAVVLEVNVIDEEKAKVGEQTKDDDHLRVLDRCHAIR